MAIEKTTTENFDEIVDNIIESMFDGIDEKELLETIKGYSFSDEQVDRIVAGAAFDGYMEILNYYLDIIIFTKYNVYSVLTELLDSDTYSYENFTHVLEKVDTDCIDLLYEKCYNDLNFVELICLKADFEKLLSAIDKKSEACLTSEVFSKIITAIHGNDGYMHVSQLTELLRNEYFVKISDETRDKLIDEIFYFIQVSDSYCYYDDLTSESCSLFVEYLKSKDLCVQYFKIAEQIFIYDTVTGIEDNIKEYSEDTLIDFFDKTKINFENEEIEEFFLYALSALGYTRLINKFKEKISNNMLNDMLYYALFHKRLKTASYLLKTFGINNFEITEDIIDAIKRKKLSKVLLVLLKNKNNVENINWEEWFKGVNEFSDIIETYCHDVIFSEMPYDYQTLLLELIEERKNYSYVSLNEKCNKFKKFASSYGYDF